MSKIGDLKKNNISICSIRHSVFKAIEFSNSWYERKNKKKSVAYISFVKQDVDHGAVRKAVTRYFNQSLSNAFPKWKCQEPADIECWGFWTKDKLFAGIRVTPSIVRARATYRQGERIASIRPTIASAMAILSDPSPADRVIDPMCGSGTLLIERGLLESYNSLVGYDIDPDAVDLAKANANHTRLENIGIYIGDATNLLLKSQRFNCLLSNLPFGKVYGNRQTNFALYQKCLNEWSRLLESGGCAILLTADTKSFHQALKGFNNTWKIRTRFQVKVLGIWANCFILDKL